MQMAHAAAASGRKTSARTAKSAAHPRGSITPGRTNWLRPTRIPKTSQARPSRGRTAATQKPSRIESQGMKINVIRAKLHHVR